MEHQIARKNYGNYGIVAVEFFKRRIRLWFIFPFKHSAVLVDFIWDCIKDTKGARNSD